MQPVLEVTNFALKQTRTGDLDIGLGVMAMRKGNYDRTCESQLEDYLNDPKTTRYEWEVILIMSFLCFVKLLKIV